MTKGILLAVLTTFLMALWDVISRFSVSELDANPALFSALVLFSAAFTLTIIAGPGKGGMNTLRSPYTWLYALFQILTGVFEAYAYTFLTTTEANLLFRFSVILSLVMAFVIFGRKPGRGDLMGGLMIAGGLVYLCITLPENIRYLGMIAVGVSALFYTFRTFVAEVHPESVAAGSIKAQCRVTGVVLMASSMVFILFYSLLGYVFDATGATGALHGLPSVAEFKNPPAILAGLVCGMFVVALGKYLYFYLTKTIKTENYMVVTAFAPLFTVMIELLWSQVAPLDVSSLDYHDLIAGTIITGGALFMVLLRSRKGKNA